MHTPSIIDRAFPKMSASSAVYPTICESDDALHLAYYLPDGESSAVVRFSGVRRWYYGYPNDEGLSEHPLYGRGLRHYHFHAVPAVPPGGHTHWIGTFHDGTFEVEALDFVVVADELEGYGPAEALEHLAISGHTRSLDE